MTNSKNKGFLVPLIAVGALAIAGLGGGGCSSDDDNTDQPAADAGTDSSSKGGSAGKGGSAPSCGTANKCTDKDDCLKITCTCPGGKTVDVPPACNSGCCLELAAACKDVCPTGVGGSGQGGSGQGGAAQGGAAGAPQGGAAGEAGAAQGGAAGEAGAAQGGAAGEAGAAQGGAAGQAGAAGSGGGTITGGLVINEVDYDQPGNDIAEFIEILNTGTDPIVLDGLAVALVNGNSNKAVLYGGGNPAAPIPLTGTLNGGQYLLLHGNGTAAIPFVPPASCSLTLTLGLPENAVQNGAPDAILLFKVADGTVIDAVSYEGSTVALVHGGFTMATTEGTGTTAADLDTDVTASISRLPNGSDTNNNDADFKHTTTPTPCAANVP